MIKRAQILATARLLVGTPYHHQGRIASGFVDCAGLLAAICDQIGVEYHDASAYSPRGDSKLLCKMLNESFDVSETPNIGDIAWLWIRRQDEPVHLGILTDKGLIHTHSGVGKVVEHALDARWVERIFRVYSFRDVEPSLSSLNLNFTRVVELPCGCGKEKR